jgi:hypothetical protein
MSQRRGAHRNLGVGERGVRIADGLSQRSQACLSGEELVEKRSGGWRWRRQRVEVVEQTMPLGLAEHVER